MSKAEAKWRNGPAAATADREKRQIVKKLNRPVVDTAGRFFALCTVLGEALARNPSVTACAVSHPFAQGGALMRRETHTARYSKGCIEMRPLLLGKLGFGNWLVLGDDCHFGFALPEVQLLYNQINSDSFAVFAITISLSSACSGAWGSISTLTDSPL